MSVSYIKVEIYSEKIYTCITKFRRMDTLRVFSLSILFLGDRFTVRGGHRRCRSSFLSLPAGLDPVENSVVSPIVDEPVFAPWCWNSFFSICPNNSSASSVGKCTSTMVRRWGDFKKPSQLGERATDFAQHHPNGVSTPITSCMDEPSG